MEIATDVRLRQIEAAIVAIGGGGGTTVHPVTTIRVVHDQDQDAAGFNDYFTVPVGFVWVILGGSLSYSVKQTGAFVAESEARALIVDAAFSLVAGLAMISSKLAAANEHSNSIIGIHKTYMKAGEHVRLQVVNTSGNPADFRCRLLLDVLQFGPVSDLSLVL